MATGELLAGCASRDITPPAGIHMGGYWGRKSGAVEARDPLMAKALVFAQGGRRAALVALDLVGLDAGTVRQLRARIEERTGIPGAGVMSCCSHTHAGPLTLPFRGMGEMDPGYMRRVEEAVVEVVAQAAGQLQPARLAQARAPAHLGINRRQWREGRMVIGENPQGPVADYAHVVRVGERAVLFSHACHPVILGSANHCLSSEFPGAAARYVEARTNRTALFVNGACGDINPRQRGDFSQVEQAGATLGEAVLQGLAAARELSGEGIDYISEQVPLPLIDPLPRLQAEIEKLALQLKAEIEKGGDGWAQRVPRARLEWAEQMLALARRGSRGQVQPFEIQGLRIGNLLLLGMEGEIFVRYQLELEPLSSLQPAILCGYANGCIGYVPTADEYPRGGYEVDEAYKLYPSVQMIGPESEGLIREEAVRIMEQLASAR